MSNLSSGAEAEPMNALSAAPGPGGKSGLPALACLIAGVLAMSGCAQAPQHSARHHGKEYFSEAIYGRASPKVIADGEPVPKGGGQYLVGKPYTIAGKTYVPSERKYTAVGLASWYGSAFHGRRTANGEIYDRDAITAAHPTMPLPCYARITNLRNHRSMIVRVNDRGPFHSNRLMDLSSRAAEALGYRNVGTTKIKVEYVGRASLAGSDDQKLLATLRLDGHPAELGDYAFSGARLAEQDAPPPAEAARAETPARVEEQQRAAFNPEPDRAEPDRAEPERVAPAKAAAAFRQALTAPRSAEFAPTPAAKRSHQTIAASDKPAPTLKSARAETPTPVVKPVAGHKQALAARPTAAEKLAVAEKPALRGPLRPVEHLAQGEKPVRPAKAAAHEKLAQSEKLALAEMASAPSGHMPTPPQRPVAQLERKPAAHKDVARKDAARRLRDDDAPVDIAGR